MLKIGVYLTVWMHVCRNIPRFTVCCNIKQSEITFKIVVNLGIGTHASCTLSNITNDLGRSWGMAMYIYIYIHIYIFYVAPSKHDG